MGLASTMRRLLSCPPHPSCMVLTGRCRCSHLLLNARGRYAHTVSEMNIIHTANPEPAGRFSADAKECDGSHFITGSTDGLGRAAARTLIDEGHQVVLHARSRSAPPRSTILRRDPLA